MTEEDEGPRHVLSGRWSLDDRFAEQVPHLIDSLAKRTGIPRDQLDGTLDSLDRVDQAVERIGWQYFVGPEGFPMLVAYVGEVLRRERRAQWMARFDRRFGVWEPWLVSPSGAEFAPFMIVYETLHESAVWSDERKPGSLRFAVQVAR